MKKLIIVGNAAAAKLMYDYVVTDSRYHIVAFAADVQYIKSADLNGYPVVDLEEIVMDYHPSEHSILLAVGYGDLNRNREGIFHRLKERGYTIETYIHPDAKVYSKVIGEGSIIMPNAFIDVKTEVGENTVIWGNSSVAHNVKIEANCWLATGCVLSGGVQLGKNTFVGVSATVVNDVQIGSHNIIGAGALIVKCTGDYKVHISRQTEEFRLGAEDYLRFTKM